MAKIDFDELFQTLKNGIVDLATNTAKNYFDVVKKAGLQMADEMKDDLAEWTKQYAAGEIGKSDLEFLVKSQITEIKLQVLKNEIKAAVEFDEFKVGLVNLITNTIATVI